jgi:prepilin-type N-terminal cleavage/methylation domain-containing protein
MNNKLNKGGFTLIELLVVVLIIGILSSIALPQYTKAVEKARASEAMAWLNDFVTAETTYHLARGQFTNTLDHLDIGLPADAVAKNFTIPTAASGASATGVNITLTRKDAPSMSYSLKVIMAHAANDDKITTQRQCTGTAKICNAITNGRACGSEADSNWCYKATT